LTQSRTDLDPRFTTWERIEPPRLNIGFPEIVHSAGLHLLIIPIAQTPEKKSSAKAQ
jgi:hypothetical protein